MTDATQKTLAEKAVALTRELESLPIVTTAFKLLEQNLDPKYVFHSIEHTKDVFQEAVLFALTDGRTPREIELISIAAAYHDVGFLEGAEGHEQRSADIVAQEMEKEGSFEEQEVVLVRRMILDTHLNETHQGMKQRATTGLSRYLLDADLSNFGRDDFFERLKLYAEELGLEQSALASNTHTLMSRHYWKTEAAKSLREPKKRENIKVLAEKFDLEAVPEDTPS